MLTIFLTGFVAGVVLTLIGFGAATATYFTLDLLCGDDDE